LIILLCLVAVLFNGLGILRYLAGDSSLEVLIVLVYFNLLLQLDHFFLILILNL